MGGSGLRSCSRKITASRIEGPLPTTQTLHLEVDSRLQQVDDPGGVLQDKLVAVKCTADHLELHVRGVTAEPWGHGRILLQRDRKGAWRLVPSTLSPKP